MNLKQYYLTKNECYQRNEYIEVKGLMLHSTGANNPTLKRYVPNFDGSIGDNTYGNHWDQFRPEGGQVCVHGFIGKLEDGSIATVQTLPWNMRGWHAGGKANDTHIGVEICEDDLTDNNYFNKVYNEAVELFAYLCKEFNLDPMNNIICHSEGASKGIASNHGDVMHWFPKHGKSMNTFRNDVKIKMGNTTDSKPSEPVENKPTSNVNYLVKIKTSVLNVRKGDSTDYPIVTTVKKNEIYTIVDESINKYGNKWGKLKSGAGWILLDDRYVEPYNGNTTSNTVVNKKISVGSKVKIKSSASKYCTGETIPNFIKGRTYTVQQVGTTKYPNGILLEEIVSWVNKSDLDY